MAIVGEIKMDLLTAFDDDIHVIQELIVDGILFLRFVDGMLVYRHYVNVKISVKVKAIYRPTSSLNGLKEIVIDITIAGGPEKIFEVYEILKITGKVNVGIKLTVKAAFEDMKLQKISFISTGFINPFLQAAVMELIKSSFGISANVISQAIRNGDGSIEEPSFNFRIIWPIEVIAMVSKRIYPNRQST